MSEQGKAKRNCEYSSTIVKKYWILETLNKGRLKSKFNLSNGYVALIKWAPSN